MKTRILIPLLLVCFYGHSQDFKKVDSLVSLYPSKPTASLLISKIKNDFHSDLDRARAAFTWIAKNISYDVEGLEKLEKTPKKYKSPTINQVLNSGLAICGDYSRLFSFLATQLSIPNKFVSGYAPPEKEHIGMLINNGRHAWNAFKIKGQWYYLDATWAAGGVDDLGIFHRSFKPRYFMPPKERFQQTHYTNEDTWGGEGMTFAEFNQQPNYHYEYLRDDITIVEPTKGYIVRKSTEELSFLIKTPLNARYFDIYFDKEPVFEQKRVRVGDYIVLSVPNHNGNFDYLTIYFWNKPLATYKVKSVPPENDF